MPTMRWFAVAALVLTGVLLNSPAQAQSGGCTTTETHLNCINAGSAVPGAGNFFINNLQPPPGTVDLYSLIFALGTPGIDGLTQQRWSELSDEQRANLRRALGSACGNGQCAQNQFLGRDGIVLQNGSAGLPTLPDASRTAMQQFFGNDSDIQNAFHPNQGGGIPPTDALSQARYDWIGDDPVKIVGPDRAAVINGMFKISENESPQPQDRFFFNNSYFHNAPFDPNSPVGAGLAGPGPNGSFNGQNPNGDWKLFVTDDSGARAPLGGGWTLTINDGPATPPPPPTGAANTTGGGSTTTAGGAQGATTTPPPLPGPVQGTTSFHDRSSNQFIDINVVKMPDGTLAGIGPDGHNWGPMVESKDMKGWFVFPGGRPASPPAPAPATPPPAPPTASGNPPTTPVLGNGAAGSPTYPTVSGSGTVLPNLFNPSAGGLRFNPGPGPVPPDAPPPAIHIIVFDKTTGNVLTSPTGRDICNPCLFLPNVTGEAPVIDMPTIIRAAGGQPPPQPIKIVITPANVGGPAISDQVANSQPSPKVLNWKAIFDEVQDFERNTGQNPASPLGLTPVAPPGGYGNLPGQYPGPAGSAAPPTPGR